MILKRNSIRYYSPAPESQGKVVTEGGRIISTNGKISLKIQTMTTEKKNA